MTPHILFVDDEAPIRELLSLYFRKKGLEVTTALTAAQAKELAASVPFTLAILDLNLAGENGVDLLGFFKSNYPNVPVVIFTGQSMNEVHHEQLFSQGAKAVCSRGSP